MHPSAHCGQWSNGMNFTNIVNHTWIALDIDASYIIRREGYSSILVGTLLAHLRRSLFSDLPGIHGLGLGDTVPASIANIISGSMAAGVVVATSQVPAFGHDMTLVSNGYRTMGLLSLIPIAFEAAPTTFDFRRELISVDSADDPIQKSLLRRITRGGMIDLDNYFIIILIGAPQRPEPSRSVNQSDVVDLSVDYGNPPLPAAFPRYSTITSEARASSPSNRFIANNVTEATSSQSFTGDEFSPPMAALFSRHSSSTGVDISTPSPLSNSPNQLFSLSTPPRHSPQHSPAASQFFPIQTESQARTLPQTIRDLCRMHGIHEDLISRAQCNAANRQKNLLHMIINHRAMAQILTMLSLQQRVCDPFNPTNTCTLGGRSVSAQEIVKEFGWAIDSYKHKCGWYGWAEEAIQTKEWTGIVPTLGEPPQFLVCLYY